METEIRRLRAALARREGGRGRRFAKELRPAALHDIPNKRVRNCGMVDITEESKPRLLALSPRSAILPR